MKYNKILFYTAATWVFIWSILFCIDSFAAQTPDEKMAGKGQPYFGYITQAYKDVWPDIPIKTFVPSQLEKESLWEPKAELCVYKPSCSRERGIGLAQFTVTPTFNVFNEVKPLHPLLKDWMPKDYFDPRMQIIAAVAKDYQHYRQCKPLMSNDYGAMACAASSYNGGFGGFSADRKLCSNTKGCNPMVWGGNVEITSMKAKEPLPGYGQSFFQINRGYVKALLIDNPPKYKPFFQSVASIPAPPKPTTAR